MWQDINKKLEKLKLRNRKIVNYVKSTCATRSQPHNTKFNRQSKSVRLPNDSSKPKTYNNHSQVERVNEIEETLNDKTENDTVDSDSSNVDLFSKHSDFRLCINPPQEIMQIYIDDKMTADFQVTIHDRKITTCWDTGTLNQLSVENAYKRHIAQIRYTPALTLDFPSPVAATSAQ